MPSTSGKDNRVIQASSSGSQTGQDLVVPITGGRRAVAGVPPAPELLYLCDGSLWPGHGRWAPEGHSRSAPAACTPLTGSEHPALFS